MTPETMVRFARRSSAPWFAGVALATFAVAHPAAAQSIPSQSTTSTPQDPQHDAAPAEAAAPHAAPVLRNEPWDPEVLKLAESLPIQEEGRIKPLGTFAAFKLLQMNGARTLSFTVDHGTETTSDDEKIRLTSTEWLLDCLFFPDLAVTYPCFQLQTSEVADAIHVAHDKKSKRDRYS